jgi:hypothetical protein
MVGEIAVLAPGGLFVLREPNSSMGDWRKPRPGMTANERGPPLEWLEELVRAKRFTIVTGHVCMFNPLSMIARRLGIPRPFLLRRL